MRVLFKGGAPERHSQFDAFQKLVLNRMSAQISKIFFLIIYSYTTCRVRFICYGTLGEVAKLELVD